MARNQNPSTQTEATDTASSETIETGTTGISETKVEPPKGGPASEEVAGAEFKKNAKPYLSNVDRGIDYRGAHHRAGVTFQAIPSEIESTEDFKRGFVLPAEAPKTESGT